MDVIEFKTLFIELLTVARVRASNGLGMLAVIISYCLFIISTPYIWRGYKGEYMFSNDWQMATEICLLVAKFLLNYLNIELMICLATHLKERYIMKLKLLTMIEP